MKRVESHIFQGMQRDVSISKQQPQFLWDAENIRLTAREGDTLMSVTNEKGSVESGIGALTGSYMGHCVLGNYLTVFTTTSTYDYIYLITKGPEGTFSLETLYGGSRGNSVTQGKLGFDLRHPLQTLGIYENEFIQKVYWTDGINQPRVINICKDKLSPGASLNYDENSFDFVPEMTLNDSIQIQKLSDNSGSFPAGVIQYAITYYNKYGQQSNISCVSPLIATSFANRGGSPEEKISNSFRVKISNPDRSFEYLRLYSIFRSSLNGTPICRRVEDVRLGDGGLSGSGYKVTTSGNISNWFVYRINSSYTYDNKSIPSTSESYSPTSVSNLNIPYVNPGYNYYRFTKSSHPYLVIEVYDEISKISRWITWGDATQIYISQGSAVGGYGEGYYIVGTGNDNKAANLITSNTEIVYQKAAYTSADVVITDNGIIGENVDPQELLYIGGEDITAETIESKDGTLFFGNIKLNQTQISEYEKEIQRAYSGTDGKGTKIESGIRTVLRYLALNGTNYIWGNSLNSTQDGYSTNPAGFKYGEHYRLGVQFQYKNGKWSEPIYIPNGSGDNDLGSFTINGPFPNLTDNGNSESYHTPCFNGTLGWKTSQTLYSKGYRRVRGVVVFPTAQDRIILAQGVLNPTVANVANHALHAPDYQSSWFFRPWCTQTVDNDNLILQGATVEWQHHHKLFGYTDRGSEIQGLPKEYMGNDWGIDIDGGILNAPKNVSLGNVTEPNEHGVKVTNDTAGNMFYVDQQHVTMHSPEFEFDDTLKNLDFTGTSLKKRGYITFNSNVGDIFIETSTPPVGKESQGFIHKMFTWRDSGTNCKRLCAGFFYNDWMVDENVDGDIKNYSEYPYQKYEFGFMVYPWHKSGSLNNDCNRPVNAGVRSAVLKKKIISNILYSRQTFFRDYGSSNSLAFGTMTRSTGSTSQTFTIYPQLVDDEQIGLAKLGNINYYGSIDTLLSPMAPYSSIISTGGTTSNIESEDKYRYSQYIFTVGKNTFWRGRWDCWECVSRQSGQSDGWNQGVGQENRALSISKESIRMKYKSTPHLAIKLNNYLANPVGTIQAGDSGNRPNSLHFVELCRTSNRTSDFGGISKDAIQGNTWVPAGEAVPLRTVNGNTVSYGATIPYYWGDTWYQRYDCLKTYPYTPEDENQIVEIGSFMVETHINIDGRYDRNRGQDSNLYMSKENFNTINPVYSQLDNFFSYRIMDSDFYKLDRFPATVAWTLQKNNASEVDAWTNVTMGSTLDMDGNAGEVTSINTSMDTLYCFQERGVSQIMFNSRVQISPSDGVPIEISNNYKVDGSHYISNSIGCPNKFAIAKSPMGLYFVDGVGSTLYLLQGNQMQNISDTHGMGYWFSKQDTQNPWIPGHQNNPAQGIRLCYDNVNGDLYILPHEGQALCYSDQLQQFVSFYDYYAHSIFNIGNSVHVLNEVWDSTNQVNKVYLHNLFEGNYNQLLSTYYPSSITFVSNADMQMDKIFTNLETRADFYKNGELQHMHFFDTIRAWNEYQDTDWNDGTAHTTVLQHKYFPYSSTSIASNTKKKFRIWRVDIPRAKKWIAYTAEEKQAMISSGSYTSETVPNGHFININDRIRNTWCKIKLSMNVPPSDLTGFETSKMEMHDMSVIYYI